LTPRSFMALIESANGVPGSLVISGVEEWVGVGVAGWIQHVHVKQGMILSKAPEVVEGAKSDGW